MRERHLVITSCCRRVGRAQLARQPAGLAHRGGPLHCGALAVGGPCGAAGHEVCAAAALPAVVGTAGHLARGLAVGAHPFGPAGGLAGAGEAAGGRWRRWPRRDIAHRWASLSMLHRRLPESPCTPVPLWAPPPPAVPAAAAVLTCRCPCTCPPAPSLHSSRTRRGSPWCRRLQRGRVRGGGQGGARQLR